MAMYDWSTSKAMPIYFGNWLQTLTLDGVNVGSDVGLFDVEIMSKAYSNGADDGLTVDGFCIIDCVLYFTDCYCSKLYHVQNMNQK